MATDNPFSIRPFTESDLPHLSRLISETIDHCYSGVYPPKAIHYFLEYHAPDNILRDATAGNTLVGSLNEKPVATGTLNNNYICRVFVHPECQGQDFGKKIADALERQAIAKGIETLELDASLTSRRFWEGLGWRVTSHEVEMVDDEPLEYHKMMKGLVKSKSA
jgi:GNAT superfamily N-acetyltransferase